jgi:tetratricopeptide (TPR) repeat protein
VVVFRQPLANLIWPDMRVQRLLDEAEQALQQGKLSAADGSGARERYEAAQALDSDRSEARDGLARVGQAAVAQAREHLQGNRFERARESLALARELQVPRADADAVAAQLRGRESESAGLEQLMQQADSARTKDDWKIALPLYRRVLELQPNHTAALEGREDALSELLQQGRDRIDKGDLAQGAEAIAQAQEYDAGHVDLPGAQAQFARAIEIRRRRADDDLRRLRLEPALAGYRDVLSAAPADANAQQGIERIAVAYAQRSAREASDFDFTAAQASLRQAREISPRAPVVREAEQVMARARQSQSRLGSALPAQERRRRAQVLLAAMEQAAARGEWLTPPGDSAYDKLRAAQSVAPEDPAVKRAATRVQQAVRTCFEEELRGNRIRRARTCYDAWQAMETRDAGLADARRRLSLKWIAVGDERLGSGDVEFAVQALREARGLDGNTPGLADFSARVTSAQAGGN